MLVLQMLRNFRWTGIHVSRSQLLEGVNLQSRKRIGQFVMDTGDILSFKKNVILQADGQQLPKKDMRDLSRHDCLLMM